MDHKRMAGSRQTFGDTANGPLSATPHYSNLPLFIMSPYFLFFSYEYLLPSPLSRQWLSQLSLRSKSTHWRWLTMKIIPSESWVEILLTHHLCLGKPSFWWSENDFSNKNLNEFTMKRYSHKEMRKNVIQEEEIKTPTVKN